MMKRILIFIGVLYCSGNLVAQTSGPKQPEAQSFKPVGASDMVNLFSGEFNYNIALFELPGPNGSYPFNIFYNSGPSMSDEASWVGLGWNLNPGAVNRQMRNIPDDFDGTDKIKHFKTVKDSWSVGGTFVTPTTEIAGFKIPFKANMTISYNNMTGLGVAIGGDLSFQKSDKAGFFEGIGFSSGNLNGLSLNPQFGIRGIEKQGEVGKKQNSLSIGLNLNSVNGLQSMYLGAKIRNRTYGNNFSFADQYYSPDIQRELKGGSVELSLAIGTENFYLNNRPEFKGFFSLQKIKNKGETIVVPAYGYNHLEKAKQRDGVSDFTRENEQSINLNTPILPIPVPTYDIYSVNAQGVSASFRSYRGNVGYFEDKQRFSFLSDNNLALEMAFNSSPLPAFKVGANFNTLGSFTTTPSWNFVNESKFPHYKERENVSSNNNYFEPYYYKILGQSYAMDDNHFYNMYDNGKAGYIPITGIFDPGFKLNNSINLLGGTYKSYDIEKKVHSKRVPRTQVIQHFKNAELKSGDGVLNYFDFSVYSMDKLSPGSSFHNFDIADFVQPTPYGTLRGGADKAHHTGGFEIIKEDGTRYIFGLPVYVNEQIDVSFNSFGCVNLATGDCPYVIDIPRNGNSGLNDPTKIKVTDSHQSLEVKTIPKYATTYLLTAILGTDYVDLNDDGITDDDLGYWVKFSYVKTTDDYKWKAPFYGANFIIGQESLTADNMGAFSCGSREAWYLLSAETSTHIAEFQLSTREDARGAGFYLQNKGDEISNPQSTLGAWSYKVDKILLYTKNDRFFQNGTRNNNAIPIQTVHFKYSQSDSEDLCKGICNATNGRGKLTLKSLHNTYRDNIRGQLTPYTFKYGSGEDGSVVSGKWDNPIYEQHAMDRWGVYQRDGTGRDKNYFAPYTRQSDPELTPYYNAWNLKQIKLPSGALIQVNYEAKDYAFVQNKTATVMTKIESFGKEGSKFYVDVKMPELPENISEDSKVSYIKTIFGDIDQLFFRLYVNLDPGKAYDLSENVSGYTLIDPSKIAIVDNKLRIYVNHSFSNGITNVHPFQNSVYNYIKGSRIDLLNNAFNNPNEFENTSGMEKVFAVASVIGNLASIYKIFLNVERQCQMKGLGPVTNPMNDPLSSVLLNSYVRIPVLNGRKIGGGARVKSVKVYENPDKTGDVTGMVYSYSKTENVVSSNGTVYPVEISSGVAENEPGVGSDENAVKGYEKWQNSTAVFSYLSQFSQTPYNESFYPGANIGYSQITVRSLISDQVAKGEIVDEGLEIRTTGQIVHEFYTAREFPVEISRTVLEQGSPSMRHMKIPLPLPYVKLDFSYMVASQGFMIGLNDMHGKTKKVSYYGQNKDGKIAVSPYSWQETQYHTSSQTYRSHNSSVLKTLNNYIPMMCSEGNVKNMYYGIDVEEFIDLRNSDVYTAALGAQVNVEGQTVPIGPAPVMVVVGAGFPDISITHQKVGTCVNNKVILRNGIVDKVIAFDRGAYTVVKNEVFDELTGSPVLVSTIKTDNPDNLSSSTVDKTYKYDIQGHWVFEGLDGAYKNVGHELIPDENFPYIYKAEPRENGRVYLHIDLGPQAKNIIRYYYPGDEIMISPYYGGTPDYNSLGRGVVISTQENRLIVESTSDNMSVSQSTPIYMKVTRPGRRNVIGVPVSTIVSSENPLLNRTQKTCE